MNAKAAFIVVVQIKYILITQIILSYNMILTIKSKLVLVVLLVLVVVALPSVVRVV